MDRHYLHLSPLSEQHSLPLRLLSPGRACNQRRWDHIICDYPGSKQRACPQPLMPSRGGAGQSELGAEHGAILNGVERRASPQSTMEVLLSRRLLDLCTGASHHARNNAIETPKLSLLACAMRVDLETCGRQSHGLAGRRVAPSTGKECGPGEMDCSPSRMIAVSVATNPVLDVSIDAVNVVPHTAGSLSRPI